MVVDPLESVQIDEHDADRRVGIGVVPLLNALHQGVSVVQSGQWVGQR